MLTSDEGNAIWGSDWPPVGALWPLDPDIVHINHGSFGAPEIRDRVARDPVRFFRRELAAEREVARHAIAGFLGADPAGLAFVPNATTGVSGVLRTVAFGSGDEVVVTDHGYGAVRLAVDAACRAAGARRVTAAVSLAAGQKEIVSTVCAAITPRTKLVVVDQVTSPTARLFPIADIVAAVRERGSAVLVDGARSPGMVPIALEELAPDFWVENLHKWVCAPHGSGVIYAGRSHRAAMQSIVASWDEPHGFPGFYGNTGTTDQSAWLASPVAIDLMDQLGWDRLRHHNAGLVTYGQWIVADAVGIDPADPGTSMRIVPLPAGVGTTDDDVDRLLADISDGLGIQVAASAWNGRGLLRISAHAYNRPADYDRLAFDLPDLLRSRQGGNHARGLLHES